MTTRFWVLIMCFALIVSYGCGFKKPRFYAVDRPRVDQANMGNAGYVKNEGNVGDSIAGRTTRRIYVLEFDKKTQPAAQKKSDNASSAMQTVPASDEVLSSQGSDQAKTVEVPASEQVAAASGSGVTEYTVEKDDTLQKISKKVYGSFGKWTKIYDANKDKIKNPNFVKPGVVLTIPQE